MISSHLEPRALDPSLFDGTTGLDHFCIPSLTTVVLNREWGWGAGIFGFNIKPQWFGPERWVSW